MHWVAVHGREGCCDGTVGKVAAAQLAERAADDRLDGNFGPGLQRAAQGHQALAAARRQQSHHRPVQHIAAALILLVVPVVIDNQ